MAELVYGMLDEHAPRPTDNDRGGPSEYEPTGEERSSIKLVEKLFEKAKKHRALYDSKWLDYYRFYRGNQWKEHRPSYRHSEVVNLIFRTINSQVPIQLDPRPKFEYLAEEPSDLELADIMNQIADAFWVRGNWSQELLEVVYDANIYGTGLSKQVVRGEPGKLLPTYRSADPFYCFPDPEARDTNKDCEYFIEAEPLDVVKIKARYPQRAQYIKADLIDLLQGSKTDLQPIKFRAPVEHRYSVEGTPSQEMLTKDKALLVTCWMTPKFCETEYEEYEKKVKDDAGNESLVFEKRAKYPNGRKVVICNGVLLEDAPLGYEDGEVPYARYPNYVLPREFWGMSEVEQLEGPQKTFNKLVSFALDVLTLMGNPVWLNPTTSGVDSENLRNRPGLVIDYDPPDAPVRQEGVQLQPFVMNMIKEMEGWFNNVAGDQDVSRGARPEGVTAYKAIAALQDAAQTRLRQKQRNLDCYLQNVGRQFASRIFQFLTVPEVIRITNAQGAPNYFRAYVEEYDEPGVDGESVKKKKLHVQPVTPQGMDPTAAKVYEVRGKLDIRVSTGSALPFAKAEKEQKLLQLFDRKIIDEEEVLKGSEFPSWEAVLQRMEKKAQMMAQQQAQQAPPNGGQQQ